MDTIRDMLPPYRLAQLRAALRDRGRQDLAEWCWRDPTRAVPLPEPTPDIYRQLAEVLADAEELAPTVRALRMTAEGAEWFLVNHGWPGHPDVRWHLCHEPPAEAL